MERNSRGIRGWNPAVFGIESGALIFSKRCLLMAMDLAIAYLLRGSFGYLGYVDSNQGYNLYKWVICPQILGL